MVQKFIIGLMAIIIVGLGNAQQLAAKPSHEWVAQAPTVETTGNINRKEVEKKPCVEQITPTGPYDVPLSLCVYKSKYLRYALYEKTDPLSMRHKENKLFVAFASDRNMYEVPNFLSSSEQVPIAMPNLDNFVLVVSDPDGARSWQMIKDVSKKLERLVDPISQKTSVYRLNLPNGREQLFPDPSPQGYHPMSYQYAVSRNGEWAVFYDRHNRKVIRVNLQDVTMKVIASHFGSDTAFWYAAPLPAITDDGQYVAFIGAEPVGISVFRIADDCGQNYTNGSEIAWEERVENCEQKDFRGLVSSTEGLMRPRFDPTGGRLTYYRQLGWGVTDYEKVMLTLPGFESHRLDYLALGDSFSSGEGENHDDYYAPFTNTINDSCHLSTRSYPFLLGDRLGLHKQDFRSVACSGAVMWDIVNNLNDSGYKGQGSRWAILDEPTLRDYQRDALDYFVPGRLTQVDFVRAYRPKVVSIGIGGNDAALLDKIKSCLGLWECDWVSDAKRPLVANEIKELFPRLADMYHSLKQASPGSKIYAIGYPSIINPTGQCELPFNLLLSGAEKRLIFESVRYLNQVIAAAAYKAGVKYIDVEASFGNKTLCGSHEVRAMNGIRWGEEFGSLTEWLPGSGVIGSESLHPNALGHTYIAAAIRQAVPDVLGYDVCNGQESCEQTGVVAPQPPDYWQFSSDSQYSLLINRVFAQPNKNQLSVLFDVFDFAKQSLVGLSMHSTPRNLGTFQTDENGALNKTITLPADLEPGYHTLHMTGTSPAGEPVDYYQVVLVMQDGRVLTMEQEAQEANKKSAASENQGSAAAGSQPANGTTSATVEEGAAGSKDDAATVRGQASGGGRVPELPVPETQPKDTQNSAVFWAIIVGTATVGITGIIIGWRKYRSLE